MTDLATTTTKTGPETGHEAGHEAGPDPYWPSFRRGFAVTLPIQVATIPFGLIFGVIAAETGLDLFQIFAMGAIVMAGASSLVALELLADQAPALVVVGLSAIVNLRMAMYSAAIAPHWQGAGRAPRLWAGYILNDQTFTVSIRAYDEGRLPALSARIGYFMGSGLCCIPVWTGATMAGAVLGKTIPPAWDIGAAVPILFMALSAPMIKTPAHLLACTVAMGLGVVFADLPHGLGLLLAALAGIAAGMMIRPAR